MNMIESDLGPSIVMLEGDRSRISSRDPPGEVAASADRLTGPDADLVTEKLLVVLGLRQRPVESRG